MKYRKNLKSLVVGVLVMAIMMLPLNVYSPAQVSAVSSDVLKEQLEALKEEKNIIDEQLAELRSKQEEYDDEITNIIARKNLIDQEVNLLSIQLGSINEQITTYNMLIADKQEELDDAVAQYDQLKEKNKLRIRAMEEAGELTYWQILFEANSFTDLLDRMNMVQQIAASDNQRLLELSRAAAEVKAAQEELDREKIDLETTKKELEEKQAELKIKREEADALLQEFLRKTGELDELQAKFEALEEEFLTQIANKEAEYDEAKQKEWEEFNNSNNPNVGDFGWLVPCSYVYLSSPFGYRDAPLAGASTYHQGVDLAAYRGTPVYATRAGIVTIADHGWSAGNYVQIDHQDGYKSIYMHLETYSVSAGDVVSAGQQIGTVGTSGISSGYHLHFGISYNGVYVNPCEYVDLHP